MVEEEKVKVNIDGVDYRVAVLSDIHYPFESHECIALTKAYLHDNPVDEIVLLGDIVDFYSVSFYEKDSRKPNLYEELEYAKARLQEWVDEFPNVKFRLLEGNHSNRLARFVKKNAPELACLGQLKVDALLGLEEMGIEFIPMSQHLEIGDMTFFHGSIARKNAGASVRGHFDQVGGSVIVGHCHRLSCSYKRNKQGMFTLLENGTLAKLRVEYTAFPDWANGWTIISYKGNQSSAIQVPIINGRIISANKTYEVER